jgi:hypothetical protein
MSFIPKSTKGKAIISNVVLSESIVLDCPTVDLEGDNITNIGSSSKQLNTLYTHNININGSDIASAVLSNVITPLVYTAGNLILSYNISQFSVTSNKLNINPSLFSSTAPINYNNFNYSLAYDNSLKVNTSGQLSLNPSTNMPIGYTNGTLKLNYSNTLQLDTSGNLSTNIQTDAPISYEGNPKKIGLKLKSSISLPVVGTVEGLYVTTDGDLDVKVSSLVKAGPGIITNTITEELGGILSGFLPEDIPDITPVAFMET